METMTFRGRIRKLCSVRERGDMTKLAAMRYSHWLKLLLVFIPIRCLSQIEVKDSPDIGKILPDSIQGEKIDEPANNSPSISSSDYYFMDNPATDGPSSYRFVPTPNLCIPRLQFTPGQTGLLHWNNGGIFASGSSAPFPGLMQIDSGTVGLHQTAGKFTFETDGVVNKYGYFNGLHTQYGLSGSITYQLLPRLSVTGFGEYYFGQLPGMSHGTPISPAMIGFYRRSSFGGYLDYRINEHWGVQTGVQTVQQVGTGRFQAEPIVTPYYRINRKVTIGLPVGQILYHLLRK